MLPLRKNMKKICLTLILSSTLGYAIASETAYAYITNSDDNSYTQCTVKKNVIDTTTCKIIKPQGSGALNSPVGITLDDHNAYITNYGNNSYTQCSVKHNMIDANSCKTITPSGKGSLNEPHGISILGNYVYIVNMKDSTYTQCKHGNEGIESDTCVTNSVPNLNQKASSAFITFSK